MQIELFFLLNISTPENRPIKFVLCPYIHSERIIGILQYFHIFIHFLSFMFFIFFILIFLYSGSDYVLLYKWLNVCVCVCLCVCVCVCVWLYFNVFSDINVLCSIHCKRMSLLNVESYVFINVFYLVLFYIHVCVDDVIKKMYVLYVSVLAYCPTYFGSCLMRSKEGLLKGKHLIPWAWVYRVDVLWNIL